MRMHAARCTAVLVFAVCGYSQNPFIPTPQAPLSIQDKWKIHARRTTSPTGFLRSAVTAGWDQWQNDPMEWGQGMAGYSRRFGHKVSYRAVKNGLGLSLDVTLRQDPRYFRSEEQGFWKRTPHALTYVIVTRTDSGGRTFSTWRVGSAYGAAFITNSWRPDRVGGTADALQRGTVTLGLDAVSNVLKEFWPDIKRKFRRGGN